MDLKRYYDSYWNTSHPSPENDPTTTARMNKLRRALQGMPEEFVGLDAGCGNGEFVQFLAREGGYIIGLDISTAALHRAKHSNPEAKLVAGSIDSAMPFASASFDLIWCSEVLEHLFDIPKALAEISRVLRRNGVVIITTPYHGLAKNILLSIFGFDRHFDPFGPHIRFLSKRTLGRALSLAGLKPFIWSTVGRLWPIAKMFFVAARKVS